MLEAEADEVEPGHVGDDTTLVARKTVVVESAPAQPTAFAKASASNAPVRAQASASATSGAVRKAGRTVARYPSGASFPVETMAAAQRSQPEAST